MSIAWATVALLVLLLPGFLFFTGLYIPEKFTRDVAPRSPVGQLAGSVALAFGVHGILFGISKGLCGDGVPCISLEYVFAAVQLDLASPRITAADLGANISRFWPWIVGYVGATSIAGLTVGYWAGKSAVNGGWGSFLAQHRWAHSLNLDEGATGRSFTFAYVMTHIRHEERVLMYSGPLKQFGLTREGTFAYLVLNGPKRAYLRLNATGSEVDKSFHSIGSTSGTPPGEMLLVIEGEDVANVVFRQRRYVATTKEQKKVERAIYQLVLDAFDALDSSGPR